MNKVLRALFLLAFIAVLASCPMPELSVFPRTVDVDGNGLIEISSLEMLHNMRYNLAGTGYKISADGANYNSGCPSTGCIGYELTQSLNFDTDNEASEDSSTWSGDSTTGGPYTLDPDDNNDVYFDVDEGGWLPIGDADNPFTATFDGRGNTISNLATQHNGNSVGFFGHIAGNAVIRNIGLLNNLADYNEDRGSSPVGGLVGDQNGGIIVASYTTGPASDSAGREQTIGGLVGRQNAGSIIASYATGNVHGNARSFDHVGGLVGWQRNGKIVASYATGNATAGMTTGDDSGSLIGVRTGGSSPNSYGFGTASSQDVPNSIGNPPMGIVIAALTAASAGGAEDTWNSVAESTSGAWDFGTTSQAPVLKYADYDGPNGDVYNCAMFPDPNDPDGDLCGEIIPGQYPGGR